MNILIGQFKSSKGWAGYHFRRDFQNYVASKGGRPAPVNEDDQSVDDLDDGRVQTVGVIFNGRVGSLLAVKEMLIERIPIVVIGKGRNATVWLAEAYDSWLMSQD